MAIKVNYTSGEKLASADLNAGFGAIKGSVVGGELHQFNETPTYASTPGQFRSAFAYRPVTLQVYIGKHRQVRNLDYQETSDPSATLPTKFIFLTAPGSTATNPNAVGVEIRIDYMRAGL